MHMLTRIDGVWTLVDTTTGQAVSTFGAATERWDPPAAAVAALVAASGLTAAAGSGDGMGAAFRIPVGIRQGVETDDRRRFDNIGWRDVPLPLMLMTVNSAWGHEGSVIAGRIDTVSKGADGVVSMTGFYMADENGTVAADLARTKTMPGISVDQTAKNVDFEIREVDDDGWPTDWVEIYPESTIMGATQVPFPAFPDTYIEVVDDTAEDESEDEGEPAELAASGGNLNRTLPAPLQGVRVRNSAIGSSTASSNGSCGCTAPAQLVACAAPSSPPADWFTDPQFEEVTALTITDEGRVFGHAASWDRCHTALESLQARCVQPPHSESGYAYFLTGETVCADGSRVRTAPINFGGTHADLSLDARRATAHYDNTTQAWADITCGDDDYGIWVAGALRPGLTDEDLRVIRASSLSGDWRPIGGVLEMVAVLSVNTPGYPIARARTASGQVTALVASARVDTDPVAALRREVRDLRAQLAQHSRLLAPMLDDITDRIVERVGR